MRAIIVHPTADVTEHEWQEVADVLAGLDSVARVEWFDSARAERAMDIGRKAGKVPPRKDVDG